MQLALTKMSSKGQVVIPAEMRKNIRKGEKMMIIQNKDQLIIEKVSKLHEKLSEDLKFARRTEEALDRINKGKGIRMNFDKFIGELKKW